MSKKTKRFRQKSFRMGDVQARVNLTKTLAFTGTLQDAEIIQKLSAAKPNLRGNIVTARVEKAS